MPLTSALKPLRAKAGLLRGKVLGIKKIYAYSGLAIFVILAALALLFLFPKHGKVYDSIAVLPFENLSGDSDQDYFSDEFTDELITRLYAIESLRVTSFRQVKDYKNTKKSYREIGQELKVKAVLDAGMHRVGKRVRITPKLIDAESGRAIWVPSPHERDEEDILALQSEVALDIVRKIQVVLSLDEQKRLASSQKVDPRAYDAYLEAKKNDKAFNSDPTFERWKSIYAYIQKAIDIDSQYAPFYWYLSRFWLLGQGNNFISAKEALAGAEAAIEKGLALDRDSSEMHIAAATLNQLKWDWEGCMREAKRAVELAPGDPNSHNWYSVALGTLGFFNESIAEIKRAIQLDPSFDTSGLLMGWAYFFSRRYEEAIAVLREGLQRVPNDAFAQSCLSICYAMKGMRAEASAEADKCLASLSPSEKGFLHLNVALVYAQVGRSQDALKLLDECLASRKEKPIDAYTVAEIYSALGKKDEAFRWLEKTCQERLSTMFQLKTDPFLDNLRSDPRFKEYLKLAGFEK